MYVDNNGEFPWLAVVILATVLVLTLSSCQSDAEPPEEEKSITDQLNLYEEGVGTRQDDKINVCFSPDGDNPSFVIENSYLITDVNEQRAILEYITASEYYSQDVYQRTVDSMLVEWDAHNWLNSIYEHDRLKSTNFDKESEGWSKWDFVWYAVKEKFNEIF